MLSQAEARRRLSARPATLIGRWLVYKLRRNVKRSGYARTARLMRKFGVPHVLARLILFGK